MKFKRKTRAFNQGGVAWERQLPQVDVIAQAPVRNKYATASRGHQIDKTHMAGYVDKTKTRAQIMAEARRNQEIERAAQAQDQLNQEIADKEAALLDYNASDRISAEPVQGIDVRGPNMPGLQIPNRPAPVRGGGGGNRGGGGSQAPQAPQTPPARNYGPLDPGQSMNPNRPGNIDLDVQPSYPGATNIGNTRGVVQRTLGGVGQFGGALVDGIVDLPRRAVHSVQSGLHNLDQSAGRAILGQTGQSTAYPEYQRDETFQRAGRNTGETFGHALDKLSAIPYAAGASVIDGGINAVGKGIHNLNYGAGRAAFGQTGATPQYNRVNPAMQAVQGVYGLPGSSYREGVANSDTPTYGKMYGDGKGASPIMDGVERSGKEQRAQVSKVKADAVVSNKEKKAKAAATKKRKSEERNAAILARSKGNKAVKNSRGGRLNYLQQGGALPQGGEISEEELVMDLAVRYLTARGATDIIDSEGNISSEYDDELTNLFNSEIDWDLYLDSPDEYVEEMVMSQNPEATAMARKGAKLRRLRAIKFKR